MLYLTRGINMYDKNNVFAKILRGELPLDDRKVFENDHALSFHDINPLFEKHVLVIPKGEYENILDFTKNASTEEQMAFWDCFNQTADILGIDKDFNATMNAGSAAPFIKQTVFHLHLHLVAGDRRPVFYEVLKSL